MNDATKLENTQGAVSPVRSVDLLADALTAIRALITELSMYTSVHGSDEDDEHALALGRAVLTKANEEMTERSGGMAIPSTSLLADPRVRQRKMEEYLHAVEPIVNERIRLLGCGSRGMTIDAHGNVTIGPLPERLQALDDEYVRMIERLQALHFGTANASLAPLARKDNQ